MRCVDRMLLRGKFEHDAFLGTEHASQKARSAPLNFVRGHETCSVPPGTLEVRCQ